MNLKKIRSRKALKFLGLLISAMLIATVSAALYDYMYLNATVGVEGIPLEWINGTDAIEANTNIAGVTATLGGLLGPPNGTRTYPDPVRLNNTGGSGVQFNITVSDVTGQTGQLDSIIVRVYSVNTTLSIENVTVWSGGTKGSDVDNLNIPSGHQWRFQWEITWKATASTSDSVQVNLKLEVPVA
jgi:hypothetical protein